LGSRNNEATYIDFTHSSGSEQPKQYAVIQAGPDINNNNKPVFWITGVNGAEVNIAGGNGAKVCISNRDILAEIDSRQSDAVFLDFTKISGCTLITPNPPEQGRYYDHIVHFNPEFARAPKVMVALNGFDIAISGTDDLDVRLGTSILNVSTTQATIRISTWWKTKIWSISFTWTASVF
jgi:hypothetical protein